MSVESMYQEIILDHYKAKHGSGLRDPYEAEVTHVNPSCGDEILLRVHLDGDTVFGAQPRGHLVEHVFAACGQDQPVPASRQLGGQCLTDPLRGSGDDGAGFRTGSGNWHGAIVECQEWGTRRWASADPGDPGSWRGRCGTPAPPA